MKLVHEEAKPNIYGDHLVTVTEAVVAQFHISKLDAIKASVDLFLKWQDHLKLFLMMDVLISWFSEKS